MAYQYLIDPDTNCVFVHHSGITAIDDISALKQLDIPASHDWNLNPPTTD